MICVTATVKARAGREAELGKALKSLVGPTRQEEGCIQYDLHVSADDPRSFLFYERWTDAEALEAHLKMPYIQAAFVAAEELADGEPVITTYSLVDAAPVE